MNSELLFDFLFEGVPPVMLLSILSDLPLLKILAPGPDPLVPFLSKFVIDVFEQADKDPIVLTFPVSAILPVE